MDNNASLAMWNTSVAQSNESAVTTMTPGTVSSIDKTAIRSAYFYFMGIILVTGLIGNSLALCVFSLSAKLRRTVSGHYLLALTVADTVFLIADLIRWLNPPYSNEFYMGINFMNTNAAVCKTVHFLRYTGKFASAWLTVAITVQRLLTIIKPFQVGLIYTTQRVKITIVVISVIAIAVSAFPIWEFDSLVYNGMHVCAYTSKVLYHRWNLAVLGIGGLYVPGIVILILTSIIVYHLVKRTTVREKQLNVSVRQSTMEAHLSGMMVAVALAFLALRTPYAVVYKINDTKHFLWPNLDPHAAHRIYCAYKITDVIATSNYGINFILYCLCGTVFRKCFVQLFCRCCTRGEKVTRVSETKLSTIPFSQ